MIADMRDAAALRAEALRTLGRAVPISAVPISVANGDADADLLDPQEEILTSSAARCRRGSLQVTSSR